MKADPTWAEIRPDDGSDCISFQQIESYRAPEWPGQTVPQQMHIDLMVEDLDEGEKAVLALGGTKADTQPGTTFRVFLTPPAIRSASAWTERTATERTAFGEGHRGARSSARIR